MFQYISIWILTLIYNICTGPGFFLPIETQNRKSINLLKLTDIGEFGLLRKERPSVPSHFHSGIDIRRPSQNYFNEPVFPVTQGIVISKRSDGPYAQLIIQHKTGSLEFWSVYEHISGIRVGLFELVNPELPIARFMNRNELNQYGWQFDHVHFEVLKVRPATLKPDEKNPERCYSSYSLVCYTKEGLIKYFYNPAKFLGMRLQN